MSRLGMRLITAVAVVVVVVILVWVFVVDLVVERAVERKGTETVGALVEVGSADLDIFPPGVTLAGVKVTNPTRPMTNALEAKSISMDLDGRRLLSRKIHIEEMRIEGVRLGTPRKTSGAVKGGAPPAPGGFAEGLSLPAFTLPDPGEILAAEELTTVTEIEALASEIESARRLWETRLEGLLDKARIEEFKKRAEAIKEIAGGDGGLPGIIGAAGLVASLQKDIGEYASGIESVGHDLTGEIEGYHKRVEALAAAPRKDARRLAKKYGLTAEGAGNLSRLIFGPAVAEWTEAALAWYARLAPMAGDGQERGGGGGGGGGGPASVDKAREPGLLIEKALVTVDLRGGRIEGTLKDVTTDPHLHGRPTTVAFKGSGRGGLGSVRLDGIFDRTVPEKPSDNVSLDIKGLALAGVELFDTEGLRAVVKKATADISVDVGLGRAAGGGGGGGGAGGLAGRSIEATLRAVFDPVVIDSRSGEDRVSRILASTMAGIKSFDLKAEVRGVAGDYAIDLSSDIDRLLAAAVVNLVRDEARRLERELTGEIRGRVEGPMTELRGRLGGLDLMADELGSRRGAAYEILKETGLDAPGGIKLPF